MTDSVRKKLVECLRDTIVHAEVDLGFHASQQLAESTAEQVLDILAGRDEAMDEAGSAEFTYRLRKGWLESDADEHFESIAAIRSAMMQAAKKP